jgi:hypothetical protein
VMHALTKSGKPQPRGPKLLAQQIGFIPEAPTCQDATCPEFALPGGYSPIA